MAGNSPATVKDIARHAGVSIGTVDRVLHDRGRVSSETVQRVWAAVKKLNYSPNLVARNLSKAEHKVFGILMPRTDQDSGYWSLTSAGIDSALGELSHHYLNVRYFHYDRFSRASFRLAAEKLLSEKPDGILLAPALSEETRKFISRTGDIPCVVFDGEVPDTHVLSTISQDSYESGLLAGKLMHLLVPEGNLMTVTIGSADYHLRRRREGFVRYFDGHKEVQLSHLDLDHGLSGPELGDALRGTDVEAQGVFVTNALGHLVAHQLNGGGGTHTPVIGYDLISANASCLRAGMMDFVINQEPRRQGYSSVYVLYRHIILREQVEPRIRMPIDIVMRENLDFHLTDTHSSGALRRSEATQERIVSAALKEEEMEK